MADPLSIAAGAAGLISLSGTILAEGYHYIKSVQEAPTQLRCLLSEIAGLNILFDRLQTLVEKESSGQASTAFQALVNSGAITDSLEVLQKIEGLVATCQQVSGQRKRNFGKTLFWPLKEGATQTLLARLRRLKDTFTAALSVDTAVVVQRIENQTNAIAQDVSELKCSKDQQEILGWLCPVHVNVEENFENALRLRESGTGNWFFDLPLFHAWTKNSNGLFWISGIPGSGKTVLAATIIEYLRRLGKDIGLAYFFCDHKNRDKQTFRTFLSTIVYQLYEQNASCMNDIEGIYHRLKKGTSTSPTLNLSDLKVLLQSISYRFKRTIIVVDALDECQEVAEFARGLQQLATESDGESSSQATVQLLVTSREDLVIETELLAKDGIHISLSREQNVDDDIRLYITNQVEHRLARGILKLRNAHLKAEIISTISDRAGTMFLWAAIQLDQLSRLHSDRAIKNALGNLPRGLDETYMQILHKIQEENPDSIESVKAMLRWLVGSANPLTLDQLAEAISIEPNDTYRDSDAIATDPRDVLTLCRSLVRVDHHERSRSPFVHLAHLSIQEYITSPRILGSPVAEFYLDPIDTVARLAKTSIQYLQLLDFKLPCLSQADLETRIQAYPFLRSAAQQWHVQVRRALDNGSLSIDELIRSLRWFLSTDLVEQHYASWRQAYQFPSTVQEIKAMYYAVLFGLEPLVEYLLETGVDVNDSVLETGIDSIHPVEHGPFGFNDWTALHVASFSGHANLVRILVAKGALLEARMGTRALTPLHIAAEVANKDVVEVLISAGASIHATSHSGTTAFYRAARGGSVKILELLYKAGSDINVQIWDHWTPVFEAIEMGREDVLDKLLSWGAGLQVVNDAERTPLLTAVSFERPRMVQKIANKLRQIARTEGRTPFTDEAESHTLKGQSVPSFIIRICCQCRTGHVYAIQAEACVVCHHYFCGGCKSVGRCIALRNEDLQTTSAKPLPKKSVTEARAALDDQEK